MKTNSEKNNSKLIIIILSLLLAALSIFTIFNLNKSTNKIDDLTETKLQLQKDLDAKIAELDNAMTNNDSVNFELSETKNKLIQLRDSIIQLKTIDRQSINKLNLRIAELEKVKQKLIKDVDSLKAANVVLGVEIDSAKANIERQSVTIQEKTSENENLSNQNTQLSDKVTKGAALKISNVKAITLKERSSGKLKETDNANKVDAFRISFLIRENAIANSGNRKIYVLIQDATGKTVSSKGSFYDVNGEQHEYTDVTDVNYTNNDLEVITVTDVKSGTLTKGDYNIKVYLEDTYLGSTKVALK
jgi:type III secretory pathway component EscV